MCISIGSTEVTWNFTLSSELNVTAGSSCTLIYMNNANCCGLKLHRYELKFEAESVFYQFHIVTQLELPNLEHCAVESTRINATVCEGGLPVCTSGRSQTDSQCVAQISTTPVLSSTTLLAQSNSTDLAGAIIEPTPSVPSSIASPSNATGCMLGGVSCHVVYPAVGLGVFAVIVVLLVVVVIVLACIAVTRGKKKLQGEE